MQLPAEVQAEIYDEKKNRENEEKQAKESEEAADNQKPIRTLKDLIETIKEFEQEKENPKLSRPNKFALALTAFWNIMVIPLFINAARRFPTIYAAVLNELQTNPYFKKVLINIIAKAIGLDAATARTEAFMITTLMVVLSILATFSTAIYQSIKLLSKRKDYQNIINEFENKSCSESFQFKMLEIPTKQLKEILTALKESKKDVEQSNAENNITAQQIKKILQGIDLSWWEKTATNINNYFAEASKYTTIMVPFSLLAGLAWMTSEAIKAAPDLNCSTFPLFALLLNTCQPDDQMNVISLTIYPWFLVSATVFSTHTLAAITGPILKCLPKIKKTLVEKINNPLKNWLNDERWLNYDVIYTLLLPTLAPAILIYSFTVTNTLINEEAEENYCVSLWEAVKAIATNNYGNDNLCNAEQLSMLLLSWIGSLEIGKIYSAMLAVKLAAWLLSVVVNRIPFLNTENAKNLAQKILNYLTKTMRAAAKGAGLGVVIGGVAAFFPARNLANNILGEGIYYLEKILNFIIRIPIINGDPNVNIFGLFFHSLVDDIPGLDPVLAARATGGFVAPFWIAVSLMAITAFFLIFYGKILKDAAPVLLRKTCGALEVVKKCCEKKPDNDDPTRPLLPNKPRHKQSCGERVKNVFTSWCSYFGGKPSVDKQESRPPSSPMMRIILNANNNRSDDFENEYIQQQEHDDPNQPSMPVRYQREHQTSLSK